MQSGCSGAQLEEYRRLADRIMGNLYLHMLKPVFDEHPDLQPPEQGNETARSLSDEIARQLLQLMNQITSTLQDVRGMSGARLGPYFDEGESDVHETVAEVRRFIRGSRSDRGTENCD